jgi:cell division inhibitor SepF
LASFRQFVSYLGLGPDEDYDDFDAPDPRAHELPARPPQRVRPTNAAPPPARRPAPPPPEPVYEDDRGDGGVVRMMPQQGTRPPAQRDDRRPRSVVRPMAPTPTASKPQKVTPSSFNDAQEIADIFKRRQPVIVNLEGADRDLRRRLIDFASGVCYGLGGSMERVAGDVYLITPTDVELPPDERRRISGHEE